VASRDFSLAYDVSGFSWDPTKLAHIKGLGFQLFRSDVNGNYNPTGKVREPGELTLPNISASAMTEIRAVNVCSRIEEIENENTGVKEKKGSLDYRVSMDGGTTYLYWDGGAWSIATDPNLHWTTKADLDTNLPALAFDASSGARQFRLRIRISPDATLEFTPIVLYVLVHYAVQYDPEEEVLRTIHNFLESNLRMRLVAGKRQQTTGTSFTIKFPQIVPDSQVLAVYNITDDPGMVTDLLSSVSSTSVGTDKNGRTITEHTISLTGSVDAGKEFRIPLLRS